MIYCYPNGDQTASIQAFLGSVPDGTSDAPTEVVFAPASYRVDGTITLTGRSNLIIDGTGSEFVRSTRQTSRTAGHWRLNDCAGIVILGLSVRGEADDVMGYVSSLEAQHGVTISGCTNITLNDVHVDKVWGDAVNVCASPDQQRWSQNVAVVGAVIGHVHRQGYSVTSGRNITFDGGTLAKTDRSVLDIEANSMSGGATNIQLLNHRIDAHRLNFVPMGGSGVVDGVLIQGNTTRHLGVVAYGDDVKKRTNIRVIDNVGTITAGNPNGSLMIFNGVQGELTITGNQEPLQPGRVPPMRVARWDDYTAQHATITYEGNTDDLG